MIDWKLYQRLSYFQVFKILRLILLAAAFGGGGHYLRYNGGEELILASVILYFLAALAALETLLLIFKLIPKILYYVFVVMRPGKQKGSAGWATADEIQDSGLFKRKRNFLIGLYENKPIFAPLESSGVVLSPSGGGKTSRFMVTNLCSNPENMIVTDLKDNLAVMTAKFRKKKLNHNIVIVNLAKQMYGAKEFYARYNLLQVLVNDWSDPNLHCYLFSDAYEIAYILVEEADHKSTNDFFPNASRKFFVFAALFLLVTKNTVTLPDVLVLLSDMDAFRSAVTQMRYSDLLNGDLARLASDLWTKINDAKAEQLESFREGMLQPLESFSPSGSLANNISESDFSFSDMRKQKMTVYFVPDPTRPKAFKKAVELLTWSSFTETMRQPKGRKIVYMLDEAGNIRLPNLPVYQTLTREYQIVLVIVLQALQQWSVYGGESAIEQLLSQCEWFMVMGSPESMKTCSLISSLLGEATEKQINHSLGKTILDPVTKSVSEVPRRLMTPDEVRRNKAIIQIRRGERPVLLDPIGYNNIAPMKWQVEDNPYYDKPYRGKTRLWLINWPWR